MLRVSRALPNPAGKDRNLAGQATNDQLNREWVQFTNEGAAAVSVDGVGIFHYTFNDRCENTGEDRLTTFTNQLAAGASVRLHTGQGTTVTQNSVTHIYLGRANYVWNNWCGDTAVLRNGAGQLLDWASYDRNPPEGVELVRQPGTNRLVPVPVAAYGGR